MKKLLIIDNYDSFTFNVKSYFEFLGCQVVVVKNDQIKIEDIPGFSPTHILISPGPGSPYDAGISLDVIHDYHMSYPILGVCLGHQCIGTAFGGKVVKSPQVFHGKNSIVTNDNKGVFKGLPKEYSVTRYHSLLVDPETLPESIEITAWVNNECSERVIMGLRHKVHPVFGVQFHPEAILSEFGYELFGNFLRY